jgi:hypothetical protein
MLPTGLRADQLHRGFFITVPKYAKASLAFQNSVMASLRAVRFPVSMWGR